MRYLPRKLTARHLRNGFELLECETCGALVYSRMTHDAWHVAEGRKVPVKPQPSMFRVDL